MSAEATAAAPGENKTPGGGSALRGSSLLLAGKLMAVAASLVLQVMIVRHLDKDSFGAIAYCIGAVNFLTVVASLGMEQTMSHFCAKFDQQKQYGLLRGALVFYLSCVAVIGTAVVVGTMLGREQLESAFRISEETAKVLAIMVVLTPLQALDTLWAHLFAVFGKPVTIFWRRYVLAPALKIGTVGLAMLTDSGIEFIATGFVISTLIGLVAYAPNLYSLMRKRSVFNRSTPTKLPVKRLLKYTAWAIAADTVVIVLFFSDVFMVGYFGNSDDVAILQSVQPLANGNLIAFYSLIPMFLPGLTRLFDRGNIAGAEREYARCSTWVALGTFPVAGLTIAFGPLVAVAFFGAEYAEAGLVLTLLAAGQYVMATFGLTGLTLKASNTLAALAVANVVVTVLNIVLNIFLIKAYGPLGAAIGTLVAFAVLAVAKSVIVERALGFRVFRAAFARALGTSVLAIGFLGLVQYFAEPPLWVAIGTTALVGIGLLAMNRRGLALAEVFPEARRLPVLGLLCEPEPRRHARR